MTNDESCGGITFERESLLNDNGNREQKSAFTLADVSLQERLSKLKRTLIWSADALFLFLPRFFPGAGNAVGALIRFAGASRA